MARYRDQDTGGSSPEERSLVGALPEAATSPTQQPPGSSAECLEPNNQQDRDTAHACAVTSALSDPLIW